jgi:hypothetical protein
MRKALEKLLKIPVKIQRIEQSFAGAKSIRYNSTKPENARKLPNLQLKDFLVVGKNLPKPSDLLEPETLPPYLKNIDLSGNGRKVYLDIYGLNF